MFISAARHDLPDWHGVIDVCTVLWGGVLIAAHFRKPQLRPGQRIVGPEEAAWMESAMATAMAAAMRGGEAPGAPGLKLVSDGGA